MWPPLHVYLKGNPIENGGHMFSTFAKERKQSGKEIEGDVIQFKPDRYQAKMLKIILTTTWRIGSRHLSRFRQSKFVLPNTNVNDIAIVNVDNARPRHCVSGVSREFTADVSGRGITQVGETFTTKTKSIRRITLIDISCLIDEGFCISKRTAEDYRNVELDIWMKGQKNVHRICFSRWGLEDRQLT